MPKAVAQQLRLFFDGQCPFCRREVEWLKARDGEGNLLLEDIAAVGFDAERFGLDAGEVSQVLHAQFPDGRIVRRLEAVRAAYAAVGLGWLVAPLGLPGVRWVADRLYGVFARYRVPLGGLFQREGCRHCRD